MMSRTFLAVALAAAISSPAEAYTDYGPSDISAMASALVLLSPVIITYVDSDLSEKASEAAFGEQRWSVETVRPEGDKTALELRSDDQKMKIAMTMDARLAQREQVRVGDRIDIEAVGKTGYTVRKGGVTIALLADPANGMAHSKART